MAIQPDPHLEVRWTPLGWRVARVDSVGTFTSGCLADPFEALAEVARSIQVLIKHEGIRPKRKRPAAKSRG